MKETVEVLLSKDTIDRRVGELAQEITADYENRELVLVCILKGAVIFLGDLMRRLRLPVRIDFMAVSSYGRSASTSGVVRILKDLDHSIEGKDVLLVEDIVDSGLTLDYLFRIIMKRRPRSLKVVTLLDKPSRRQVDFTPDYCGFTIPDHFIVGYGLDFDERYRQLPDICILKQF